MTKNELNIIKEHYKHLVYGCYALKNDSLKDSVYDMRDLLSALNLKDVAYTIENEVISEEKNYNYTLREVFSMVYDNFKKYNVYIHYTLEDLEHYFEELQYSMLPEEKKLNVKRIELIKSYLN